MKSVCDFLSYIGLGNNEHEEKQILGFTLFADVSVYVALSVLHIYLE